MGGWGLVRLLAEAKNSSLKERTSLPRAEDTRSGNCFGQCGEISRGGGCGEVPMQEDPKVSWTLDSSICSTDIADVFLGLRRRGERGGERAVAILCSVGLKAVPSRQPAYRRLQQIESSNRNYTKSYHAIAANQKTTCSSFN